MDRTDALANACAKTLTLVFAATITLAACEAPRDGRDRDTHRADDEASLGDSVVIRHTRSEDLTGDGRAEHLLLEAAGPRIDSLRVRLAIRSPENSVLYRYVWSSRDYFQYVARSDFSDEAADSLVRAHLARVLHDSAFGIVGPGGFTRPGGPDGRGASDTSMIDMMRDAIRYDIATNQWREQHGLPAGADLPPTAHDPINVLARAVPAARIQALVDELRGRRAFLFFAGGEVSYAIAWSDRAQRFVTIFACC